MVDSEKILKQIQNNGGDSDIETIENLINSMDRTSIEQTQKDRFRYEIWDKKTEINGVSAQDIIKSKGYTIGSVYLIYIDNKLVYLQDHKPNESGYVKMTKAEATKIAQEFITKKIEESTDNIIINKVINTILSNN